MRTDLLIIFLFMIAVGIGLILYGNYMHTASMDFAMFTGYNGEYEQFQIAGLGVAFMGVIGLIFSYDK